MKGKLIHKIYYYDDIQKIDKGGIELRPIIIKFPIDRLDDTSIQYFKLEMNEYLKIPKEQLCHFSKYMGADALIECGVIYRMLKFDK
uniref:Uncharacterized protein n=1 Tax=viral metagenome TaxID=1070528 RepID=A0A6C0CME5_9ZZZZ